MREREDVLDRKWRMGGRIKMDEGTTREGWTYDMTVSTPKNKSRGAFIQRDISTGECTACTYCTIFRQHDVNKQEHF